MNPDWAEQFKSKLKVKELARQEHKKSFDVYQQAVAKLFEMIERKIKGVECIQAARYMVSQSEITPVQIRGLKLQCLEKYIEFMPEGINFDTSKGTIRLRHNCSALNPFIYLNLIVDPQSTLPYPENLMCR